jgi:hypothetical protein
MVASGAPKGLQLDLDVVRRQKIADVEALTKRPLVVYAVDVMNPQKTASNPIQSLLNFGDKDGFVEATRRLDGTKLDVLIQSMGGLAEAVESIVAILRGKYKSLRFIVPSVAKSAATMLALSGDMVVGSTTTELGQFDTATAALKKDPASMPAWLPILQQYAPSLLQECKNRQALSEKLVSTWLETYMFKGDANAHDHAQEVAAKLNEHNIWLAHGRRVDLKWLKDDAKVKVLDLKTKPALAAAVWGLHLAIGITFSSSGAFKIVENSKGDALVGAVQMMGLQLLQQPMPQPPPPALPPP